MARIFTDDDAISYCSSAVGDGYATIRSRKSCVLRYHDVQSLKKASKGQAFDVSSLQRDSVLDFAPPRPRINKIFHNYRFLIVMLGGLSVGNIFFLRYNVTVAILKMVNQTAIYLEEHPDRTIDDFLAEGYSEGGEFDWDNEVQHMIMSWYMVSYTIPQIATTKIGTIVGARLTVPISLTICAISTLLTPTFAYWGSEWVIFLRLVNGIGASAVIPMMINLIENWLPYDQMTLGLTWAQVLQALVSTAIPMISGYLAAIHWSWAFYVPGAATIVFCALWLILVTDTPDDSWLISQKELDRICRCNDASHRHNQTAHSKGSKPRQVDLEKTQGAPTDPQEISWSRVLTFPSFYAFIVIWCCYCSTYSGFYFVLPNYLRQFLKIGISENGLYCTIIQSGCILSFLWPQGFLSLMQNYFGLTETTTRRLAQTLICLMCAFTWAYVGWFHDSQLILLFINRIFHSSTDVIVVGTLMSNYAKVGLSSVVFSMVNTVGNLTIVFAATAIGYVLDYTSQSREGWCWIYTGLAVGQIVLMLVYITCIRAGPMDFGKRETKMSDMRTEPSKNHNEIKC